VDVSILVVMDWVQRPLRTIIEGPEHTLVSILVVMDWVQRPLLATIPQLSSTKFQSLL